jgi:hypothetical protein
MATKSKVQFELEQSKKENERLRAQMQSLARSVPKVRAPKVYKPVAQRSWADDSDWESDDDEDVAVEDAW